MVTDVERLTAWIEWAAEYLDFVRDPPLYDDEPAIYRGAMQRVSETLREYALTGGSISRVAAPSLGEGGDHA